MNPQETLQHFKSFLGLLPGLALESDNETPCFFRLMFVICNSNSLSFLAYAAVKANVALNVDVTGMHDNEDFLRYELLIPIEGSPCSPPSKLQLIARILLIQLKKHGYLHLTDTDGLLRQWDIKV